MAKRRMIRTFRPADNLPRQKLHHLLSGPLVDIVRRPMGQAVGYQIVLTPDICRKRARPVY